MDEVAIIVDFFSKEETRKILDLDNKQRKINNRRKDLLDSQSANNLQDLLKIIISSEKIINKNKESLHAHLKP